MLTTRRMVFAGFNSEKFAVFQQLIAGYPGIELARADSVIRNPEKLRFVVDWKRPCIENAISKARVLGQGSHYPVLSESACIELGKGGERGIIPDDDLDLCYSTRSDGSPLEQLTRLLRGKPIPGVLDSAVALLIEGVMLSAVERLEGTLIAEPRGSLGCGFDSIFIPSGEDRTLAEMDREARSRYSPRDRAVRSVLEQMSEHGLILVKPQAS